LTLGVRVGGVQPDQVGISNIHYNFFY